MAANISRQSFISACRDGQLPLAQWIWACGLDLADARGGDDLGFRLACGGGHLDVAQWVCSLGEPAEGLRAPPPDEFFTRCDRYSAALSYACAGGHLEVARWVWAVLTLSPLSDREKSRSCSSALRLACAGGHLDVAQWLHGLGMSLADVRADHNGAFRDACAEGKMLVAGWLFGLGLTTEDVHDFGGDALARARMHGHDEMARWIISLDDGLIVASMRRCVVSSGLPGPPLQA